MARLRHYKIFTEGAPDALSQAEVALGWEVQMTTPRRPGMTIQAKILGAIAMSGLAVFAMTSQANALTAQECSAKYQAAKAAGTLGDQKWNDFRKAQCGADAAAATPAAAPAGAPKEAAKKESRKEAKEAAAPAAPSGPASYPNAVDTKYSKETATKQRFRTCLDQYNANKAGNANGGLKWIQKGGGYYSECNKKLKGAA
jgi:hypothetical protein